MRAGIVRGFEVEIGIGVIALRIDSVVAIGIVDFVLGIVEVARIGLVEIVGIVVGTVEQIAPAVEIVGIVVDSVGLDMVADFVEVVGIVVGSVGLEIVEEVGKKRQVVVGHLLVGFLPVGLVVRLCLLAHFLDLDYMYLRIVDKIAGKN